MTIILKQDDLIKMVKKQLKSITGNQDIKIDFYTKDHLIKDLTVQMELFLENIESVNPSNLGSKPRSPHDLERPKKDAPYNPINSDIKY